MTVFCMFCLWQGCSSKMNYNKEKKSLNQDIKRLQKRYDSLQSVSNVLKIENLRFQEAYRKDSILVDSLLAEYNIQLKETEKMENKANNYLNKYNNLTKGIDKLQNNKNYKSGDLLLKSLGQKIN